MSLRPETLCDIAIFCAGVAAGVLALSMTKRPCEKCNAVVEWYEDRVQRETAPEIWVGNFYKYPTFEKPYRLTKVEPSVYQGDSLQSFTCRFERVEEAAKENP